MDKIAFDVLRYTLENTKKILKNQEKIMAQVIDVKEIMDALVAIQMALIAAFEAFVAKVSGEVIVNPTDMDALVTEAQGAIDAAKTEMDRIKSLT